jgi:MFS family permease
MSAHGTTLRRVLFTAAATSYALNCALGTSVAAHRLDTSGWRWVHHAAYVLAAVASAAAFICAVRRRHPAAAAIAPAAVPLLLIPRVSAKTRGHVAIALSAAPFVATGTVLAWL